MVEEIREVLGGQAVVGFVGEQKDFVGDAGFDRQPVQTCEDGGDGLPRLGAGENPGS